MVRSLAALWVSLLLAGCTSAPAAPASPAATASSAVPTSSAPAPGPTDTPAPQPSQAPQVIEISLRDGKVTPSGDRVSLKKGALLRLRITSDRRDELHVHGYDIEIPVWAGGSVTRDITLDSIGRFEIESHEPPLTILQLVVS